MCMAGKMCGGGRHVGGRLQLSAQVGCVCGCPVMGMN